MDNRKDSPTLNSLNSLIQEEERLVSFDIMKDESTCRLKVVKWNHS
jgi:hypothetical protein